MSGRVSETTHATLPKSPTRCVSYLWIAHGPMGSVSTTAPNLSAASGKRRKREVNGYRLTFMNPQQLRNLMEVVSGILNEVTIKCARKAGFEGIVMERLDVRGVCVVIAQLQCKVEVENENDHEPSNVDTSMLRFTINVDTFIIALKQTLAHYTIEITPIKDSLDILITSIDSTADPGAHDLNVADNGKIVNVTQMATLQPLDEVVEFDDMTYAFQIQMKKNDLYSIVKAAKDFSADHIVMSVYEQTLGDTQRVMFCLSCKGSTVSSDYFFASKIEGGVIKVEPEEDLGSAIDFSETDLKVREQFNTQYILTFLKSMDHKMITLRLNAGQPLIIVYGLGAEESYTMFVLGGRTDDSGG